MRKYTSFPNRVAVKDLKRGIIGFRLVNFKNVLWGSVSMSTFNVYSK